MCLTPWDHYGPNTLKSEEYGNCTGAQAPFQLKYLNIFKYLNRKNILIFKYFKYFSLHKIYKIFKYLNIASSRIPGPIKYLEYLIYLNRKTILIFKYCKYFSLHKIFKYCQFSDSRTNLILEIFNIFKSQKYFNV